MDITLSELNRMTDEEVRDLNKILSKKLAKKFAILTAVKLAGTALIFVAAHKLGQYVVETTPKIDE